MRSKGSNASHFIKLRSGKVDQVAPVATEKSPGSGRTLPFRVIVRDHQPGGAARTGRIARVSVIAVAGPFALTSHNQGGSFSNETVVTWNVAGAPLDPINAAFVNILLSTNGGQDFSLPLAMNIPTDGSAQVALPNLENHTARLKVTPVDNVFFAIKNSNFTILPVPPAPDPPTASNRRPI